MGREIVFKPCSFEAWQELQIAQMSDASLVDCPSCEGEGVTECECCGSERSCEECDDGKTRWEDLDARQQATYFTRQKYEQAVIEDAQAFAGWYGEDVSALLVRSGFTPWCDLGRGFHCVQAPPINFNAR